MTSKPTDGAAASAKSPTSLKFELPALDFQFGSLTEGTDIPAPLPSPIQETPTPPKTPLAGEDKENNTNPKPSSDEAGTSAKASSEGNNNLNGTIITKGLKRPADDTPLSPALSSRQGSIRRLFSRNFLNNTYEEGEAPANGSGTANGGRPVSRSNTSILDEKKAKRSSGWFRRLRPSSAASDSSPGRAGSIYQEVTKPAGPPPPMIPEFSTDGPKLDFGDQGSLGGDDLFKNIK